MKYYKEIEVDNFEVIVSKTLQYVRENTTLANVPIKYNWHRLAFRDFIIHVPEIKTAFLNYGLTPNYAALFIVYNNKQTLVHKDSYNKFARINFPILNCSDTHTNFYKNVVYEKYVHPITGIMSYNAISTDHELVDSIEIKKATVVRVLEAHKVVVPDNNPLPRITLTVGFDKDPVFLLEE